MSITLNSTGTAVNPASVQTERTARANILQASAALQLIFQQLCAKIVDDNPSLANGSGVFVPSSSSLPSGTVTTTLEAWRGLKAGTGPTYFAILYALNAMYNDDTTALNAYLSQVD